MVKVMGENLGKIIDHITQGDVTSIQKFDMRRWSRPEKGQPVIEGIEVIVRNDSDLTLDKDKKSRSTPDRNEYR